MYPDLNSLNDAITALVTSASPVFAIIQFFFDGASVPPTDGPARFPFKGGDVLLAAAWGMALPMLWRLKRPTLRTSALASYFTASVLGVTLLASAQGYTGTNTTLLVETNDTLQIPAVKLVYGRIDFGNDTTPELDGVSANGSESAAIDCTNKSEAVIKVEYSTAGASASFAVKWGDHNASQGWMMSAEQFSGIVTNASGVTTNVIETGYRHGNYLRIPNPGAKDFKIVLVDASQLQAGTVSAWGRCI
jgi:hypothetical protein